MQLKSFVRKDSRTKKMRYKSLYFWSTQNLIARYRTTEALQYPVDVRLSHKHCHAVEALSPLYKYWILVLVQVTGHCTLAFCLRLQQQCLAGLFSDILLEKHKPCHKKRNIRQVQRKTLPLAYKVVNTLAPCFLVSGTCTSLCYS